MILLNHKLHGWHILEPLLLEIDSGKSKLQ